MSELPPHDGVEEAAWKADMARTSGKGRMPSKQKASVAGKILSNPKASKAAKKSAAATLSLRAKVTAAAAKTSRTTPLVPRKR